MRRDAKSGLNEARGARKIRKGVLLPRDFAALILNELRAYFF
jgi:hypothetical protein